MTLYNGHNLKKKCNFVPPGKIGWAHKKPHETIPKSFVSFLPFWPLTRQTSGPPESPFSVEKETNQKDENVKKFQKFQKSNTDLDTHHDRPFYIQRTTFAEWLDPVC